MNIFKYIKYLKEKIHEINFVKSKKFLKEDLMMFKQLLNKITGENLTPTRKLDRSFLTYTEKGDMKCNSCISYIKDNKCEIVKGSIKEKGSCNLYTPGNDSIKKTPLDIYNKDEVGYVDKEVTCKNCCYYDTICKLMDKLNYIVPELVNLDSNVKENGCCTAWTKREIL